jgi:hypothetical protein
VRATDVSGGGSRRCDSRVRLKPAPITATAKDEKKDPTLRSEDPAPKVKTFNCRGLDAVGNGALHALEEEQAAQEDYQDGGGAGD